MSKKMRVAMVGGGGENAFFGPVHKRAIDGLPDHELVAGTLHEDPEVAQEFGKAWGFPHVYDDFETMISGGAKRNLFDYVVIVTPNFMHYGPALACLQAGIPVFCEKPLALNLQQAEKLAQEAKTRCIPFGVNYTYNGHWSTKLARAFVTSGVLGEVRRVNAFYWQGWQRVNLGIQQEHRQDPKKSGDFNCNGDINTHNHFAIRNVTGLEVTEVCFVQRIHVDGRQLDDDADCIIKLSNGGGGLCSASQIACGHQNDHGLSVYCENGSVRWRQEDPQHLTVVIGDGPEIVYTRGGEIGLDLIDNEKMRKACGEDWPIDRLKLLIEEAGRFIHLPGGHGEDFFEAVGNNHEEFGRCVQAWKDSGKKTVATDGQFDYPTIEDGLRGMQFLAACKANRDGTEKFTPVNMAV